MRHVRTRFETWGERLLNAAKVAGIWLALPFLAVWALGVWIRETFFHGEDDQG